MGGAWSGRVDWGGGGGMRGRESRNRKGVGGWGVGVAWLSIFPFNFCLFSEPFPSPRPRAAAPRTPLAAARRGPLDSDPARPHGPLLRRGPPAGPAERCPSPNAPLAGPAAALARARGPPSFADVLPPEAQEKVCTLYHLAPEFGSTLLLNCHFILTIQKFAESFKTPISRM